MLNKPFFSKLLKDYIDYKTKRSDVIKKSSDALRASKQAIFLLHRDDKKGAKESLDEARKIFSDMQKKQAIKGKRLHEEGSYRAALEEYVEAQLFFNVMTGGKIEAIKGMEIGFSEYLGGIVDVTGELVRKAINAATARDYDAVHAYHRAITDVMSELIKFDMTGRLRSKYDDAKRNLRKIEEIAYQISLKE